jgi:hypothetical protein
VVGFLRVHAEEEVNDPDMLVEIEAVARVD